MTGEEDFDVEIIEKPTQDRTSQLMYAISSDALGKLESLRGDFKVLFNLGDSFQSVCQAAIDENIKVLREEFD
jgi:hypothetical protein